jgi:hypothetical protein
MSVASRKGIRNLPAINGNDPANQYSNSKLGTIYS